MPELPEVETIRSQLEKNVIGKKILAITFVDRASKVLRGDLEQAKGKSIQEVTRFGKLLVIHLSDDISLAIHLKMTGRVSLLHTQDKVLPHTHVVFLLSGNQRLAFSDSRRFGYVHALRTLEVQNLPFINTLGKEPLKDLRFEDFENLLTRSKRPTKLLLLDQQKIAGIGNIYACEALWMARIHPKHASNTLTSIQKHNLFNAIEEVLLEGIKRGGASDNTYRNLLGGKGEYQNFFKVYGREGKQCFRCGEKIVRIGTIGGRGTWFCPSCQKKESL